MKHKDYQNKAEWFQYVNDYMNEAIVNPGIIRTTVDTHHGKRLGLWWNELNFGWIEDSRLAHRL